MALLTKESTVKWSSNNRKWYESKGYIFTKANDEFIVKTEHLVNNSPILVDYKCDECNNILSVQYKSFSRKTKCMCNPCINMHRCKKDFKSVISSFKNKGLTLISHSSDYKNNKSVLRYICDIHSNIIQTANYNTIANGHGCPPCGLDSHSRENAPNWKGGITSLNEYLRTQIQVWKIDSMKFHKFKCDITGKSFDAVHHLVPFSIIVQEILSELNIDVRRQISMYTEDERETMSNRLIAKHYEYGLGICLCKDVHILFHSLYGNETATPEQYNEFKLRYQAGEFHGDI